VVLLPTKEGDCSHTALLLSNFHLILQQKYSNYCKFSFLVQFILILLHGLLPYMIKYLMSCLCKSRFRVFHNIGYWHHVSVIAGMQLNEFQTRVNLSATYAGHGTGQVPVMICVGLDLSTAANQLAKRVLIMRRCPSDPRLRSALIHDCASIIKTATGLATELNVMLEDVALDSFEDRMNRNPNFKSFGIL